MWGPSRPAAGSTSRSLRSARAESRRSGAIHAIRYRMRTTGGRLRRLVTRGGTKLIGRDHPGIERRRPRRRQSLHHLLRALLATPEVDVAAALAHPVERLRGGPGLESAGDQPRLLLGADVLGRRLDEALGDAE